MCCFLNKYLKRFQTSWPWCVLKGELSASHVTSTCSIVTLVISGLPTGFGRSFDHMHYQTTAVTFLSLQHHNVTVHPSHSLLLSECHADCTRRHRNIAPITLFVVISHIKEQYDWPATYESSDRNGVAGVLGLLQLHLCNRTARQVFANKKSLCTTVFMLPLHTHTAHTQFKRKKYYFGW
jgi:hypothetical protein